CVRGLLGRWALVTLSRVTGRRLLAPLLAIRQSRAAARRCFTRLLSRFRCLCHSGGPHISGACGITGSAARTRGRLPARPRRREDGGYGNYFIEDTGTPALRQTRRSNLKASTASIAAFLGVRTFFDILTCCETTDLSGQRAPASTY